MALLTSNWSNYSRSKTNSAPLGRKWFGLTLLIAVVVLVGTYLVTTNAVATKGYEIKGLKVQLEKLQQDSEKLDAEVSRLQSLGNIEQDLPTNTFVAVERIEYLAAVLPGAGVAVR
jgi:predicted transcriptional regulator